MVNYAVAATSPQNFYAYLLVTASSKEEAADKFRTYLKETEVEFDAGYTFDNSDIVSSEHAGDYEGHPKEAHEWARITNNSFDENDEFPSVVLTDSGACG